VRSGKRKELLRAAPRETISPAAWTPDGKRLICSRAADAGDRSEGWRNSIWVIAVDSGTSVKLNLPFGTVGGFAIHPDGRQLAFRAGSTGDELLQVWVMEGAGRTELTKGEPAARRKVIGRNPSGPTGPIALSEILGPDNSVLDPQTGLRAVCPPGWEVSKATRFEEDFSRSDKHSLYVNFKGSDRQMTLAQISVHFDQPKNLAGKEIEAWLRNWADTSHLERRKDSRVSMGLTGYRNRPGTFMARSIAGRPALSWEGEGNHRGTDVIEYVTAIYWESGWCEARCYVRRGASPEEAAKIRVGYNSLVESVRLP
jgi:hypothetical protein